MRNPPSKPNNSMKSQPNDSIYRPSEPTKEFLKPTKQAIRSYEQHTMQAKEFHRQPTKIAKDANGQPLEYTVYNNGQPSKYTLYANGQLSKYAYMPTDSPPAHTHKMNAYLDLSAVLNHTENYSSPLPLSVGRSF